MDKNGSKPAAAGAIGVGRLLVAGLGCLLAATAAADLPEPFLSPDFAAVETEWLDQMPHSAAVAELERSGNPLNDAWYLAKSVGSFQLLPPGLLYRSYLAGEKEPRFQLVLLRDTVRKRRVWESALGGRVGLLRYGTEGAADPQGFQLDLEGAALSRVLPDEPSHMLEAVDFRFGLLGTWRHDETAVKMGYYHISSHLGDEFLKANPDFPRVNYVRDAAIMGMMRDLSEDLQVYGEMGYAIGAQGGAKPLEFQFGTQYASAAEWRLRGSPFFGINSYLREDSGFRRSMNLVAGWQWLGTDSRQRFRAGMQYYNGPSMQFSFPDRNDKFLGGGIWFDY